jgi:uncharacterized protein YdhG (YjbR/CyaY superfamily)
MANTDFKSVDEYIARHPKDVQVILQRVRGIIRKAVPGAQEAISYQIPTYKLHGGNVVYFAGWKQGTIRFPLAEPVPVKLIDRIAKFLAKEAAARAKAKLASRKKRS